MDQYAMKEILETKIPFRQLADHVNMGIIEFYSVGNMSIGASQEILDDESVIILNLFCGDHYYNICGELKEADGWKIPDDMLKEITKTWNNLFMKTMQSGRKKIWQNIQTRNSEKPSERLWRRKGLFQIS